MNNNSRGLTGRYSCVLMVTNSGRWRPRAGGKKEIT